MIKQGIADKRKHVTVTILKKREIKWLQLGENLSMVMASYECALSVVVAYGIFYRKLRFKRVSFLRSEMAITTFPSPTPFYNCCYKWQPTDKSLLWY
jgi:hypothetical protein